jgi:hypothetical protein
MEEKEELPFPIDDLELKEEPISFTEPSPLQIQEEILETYFEEPLKDTPFSEVLENFQEPEPFEITLPYEEVITEEIPLPFSEVLENFPAFECFVHKQASYGLLNGKYLIRY